MAQNTKVDIDYNVKEIIDNLDKSVVLTAEDKKRIEESLDFEKAIENIDISDNRNRVIFTDGEEQLIVEDGEFFLVSSTDSLKTKKKKKRETICLTLFYCVWRPPVSPQGHGGAQVPALR